MSQKRVEVLLAAMHQQNFDIAYRMKVQSDLLIINQCDNEEYNEIKVDGYTWRMISTTERTSSKSRNMALRHAAGDYCLFADDDEVLREGYSEIIINAFNELRNPAAVVFNVNRINYKMKKTYYRIAKIRKAPKWRGYQTPMLAIDLAKIRTKGITFNERFGSGCEWGGGEDPLFEYDILRNHLKMYEYPEVIATIDYGNGSNWFNGYTEKYFYNLGAFICFRYQNVFLRIARALFTCYRLRKEKKLSAWQKIQWMYLGGRGIKKDVTYSQFLEQRKTNNC